MACHELVPVLAGGAEHKSGVSDSFELNRLLAFLEHNGFAGRDF
jgi:hypothetical protein